MNNSPKPKTLYLLFSSTATRIGCMIRAVTRYSYGHVSVSLDPQLRDVCSFARHYFDTPFYGGFVHESRLRYCTGESSAKIKICAIPVTEEQYKLAGEFIGNIDSNSDKYLYNMISAAFVPIHLKVFIDHAYTCIEFVLALLSYCGIENAPDASHFCSIRQLNDIYDEYTVYEGSLANFKGMRNACENYIKSNALRYRIGVTVGANARLIGRMFRGIVHRKKQA